MLTIRLSNIFWECGFTLTDAEKAELKRS